MTKYVSMGLRTGALCAVLAGATINGNAAAADAAIDRTLCRSADRSGIDYIVVQDREHAHLFARLVLPTPGYQVRFVPGPERVWPPIYRLTCVPPTSPVPQVLTEHKAHIAVRGLHLGSEIHVRDGERGAALPVWAQLPQHHDPGH